MSEHHFEQGDIEALADILESERLTHCRTRGYCFGLFLFSFILLILATVTIAFLFISGRVSAGPAAEWLGALQLLVPLSAAVIGFFGIWWAAQNCIHSIERAIFAARRGRVKLFVGFLENLQCADKRKRRLWVEMVTSLVS
jgi:hypothetical protein